MSDDEVREERRVRKIGRTARGNAIRAGANVKVLHGGYAVVSVQEDVLDLTEIIFASAPWLHPVRDAFMVEAAARNVLRARRLDAWLRDEREINVGLALAAQQRAAEAGAMKALEALGLSPRSAAALGLDIASIKEKTRKDTATALARYRPQKRETAE